MVFGPFTGKDNHRCPVTFGAGFISNEGADSFSWLLSEFVEFSQVDHTRVVTAKLHSLYFRLFQRAQSNHDDIVALFDGMEELSQKLFGDTVPSVSSTDKAQRIEHLYGASRPSVVNVHPPNVVSTKGSGSRSGKRIASAIEKAIILQNKPKRRCAKCREMGHHDARNCGRKKGKSKM
ncbi:hypothetical protein SASPL_138001 [Salvia splendens]|uniref:Protein FAR1-RELATED SEQUENCE n=1 Tax=Salvia splendens TaxID=180675 RepID=A0A8X8WUC8_SALSN|nr:hypothetical protein SASPL_138001 [Salvia splendens]